MLFAVLLWASLSNLYAKRIVHESPHGYFASDSIHSYYLAQHLYEEGNWRYRPAHISAGYNDTVNYNLPVLFHLAVNFAYSSGLEVYDALILLAGILASLSALLMYLVIRDYNKTVALLSAPLFVFLFSKNFYIAMLWGQLMLIVGSFFLLAAVALLKYLKLPGMYLAMGVLISAVFMAHTSEFFFLIGFFAVFIAFDWFSKKKFDTIMAKRLVFSFLVFLVLSFYYIIIFQNTYFKSFGPSSYKLFSAVKKSGFRTAAFGDFGIVLMIALVIGALLSVYLIMSKKKVHAAVLLGLYMLGIGFLNYIGIGNRAFQTRFFWPLYLSVFLGLVLYQLIRLFIKDFNISVAAALSLMLLLIFVNIHYSKIESQGLLNQFHWDSFQWLKANTEKDAQVYFFYGDSYDQNAQLLIPGRFATYVKNNQFIETLQTRRIERKYFSRFIAIMDSNLAYRKSFLEFGYHGQEQNLTSEYDADVCDFDYYVFDKASGYSPVLAQYNMAIRGQFLEFGMQEAYQNQLVSILRNDNPGAECLPAEGLALK